MHLNSCVGLHKNTLTKQTTFYKPYMSYHFKDKSNGKVYTRSNNVMDKWSNGDQMDDTKELDMAPTSPKSVSSQPNQGEADMGSLNSDQLHDFLSQFYLIRTPYGYILGRNNPPARTSTRSVARPSHRSRQSSYGKLTFSDLLLMWRKSQTAVNACVWSSIQCCIPLCTDIFKRKGIVQKVYEKPKAWY